MCDRTIILSDLHLGRPRCAARSAAALRPLLEGAAHLVVNGDAAEVHHPRHWSRAARETIALFDLCEQAGVELTLLSGNHDPYISDIRHLHLAGGQVFVTHGDVLHPAVAPWSPGSARIRETHELTLTALESEGRDELEARLMASQHASFIELTKLKQLEEEAGHSTVLGMIVRPWALWQVLAYWRVMPRLAARFLDRHAPEARFGILGHTHHPGIWEVEDRVIINTGSFGFPGHPLAVILEEGWVAAHRLTARAGVYDLVRTPLARFPLSSTPARPDTAEVDHDDATRPTRHTA